MKRGLVSFLMICTLLFGQIPTVRAVGGEVIFRGTSERFSFAPGSKYTTTDLFTELKDAMPGDFLKETIAVANKSHHADGVKLYLRVAPHSSENSITYSESHETADGKDQTGIPGKRDETLASMSDFLSQLTLRVYHGNTLVFEDALGDPAKLEEAVYLGTLERNHSLELKLELEVPAQLDNRYANRVGEMDWIFTAEVFDDPGKPDVPRTGDGIIAAVVIMGISGLLFLLILLTGRRRK